MKAFVQTIFMLLALTGFPAYGQFRVFNAPDRGVTNGPAVQQGRVDSGSALRDGVGLYWETRVEPPESRLEAGFESRTVVGPRVVHRIMLDRMRRTYFGYDIVVDALPEVGTYLVTLGPFSMPSETIARLISEKSAEWMPLPPTRFPAPLILRSGDTLSFDLLVNTSTGQKLVDYVSIVGPSPTIVVSP